MLAEELLSRARGYYEEYREALRDYMEGRERVYAVERLAQLIAQALLDAAAVLAARERGAKPETYKGLAAWLAQRLGLGEELREFLIGLAGLRNVLVHMYAEIDPELELEAFREIEEKTPLLIEAMQRRLRGDPCLEELRPRIVEAARRLGLRVVLVYGSLARRGCGRDVDLAVRIGRKPRSLLEQGRLQAIMEDELGAPVDLVVLDASVPPSLAREILEAHVPVYAATERELEETLLRLYKLILDRPPGQAATAR